MSATSTPYISFPGNASEALPYYAELFGGELNIQTYDDMPSMEGFPFTPPPGAVAHGTMTSPTFSLAGGDGMGDNLPVLDSDVYSFLLTFDAEDEARGFIAKVLDGGGVEGMPFEMAPWGELYGQVKDKFGIRWDVNVPAQG